MMSPRSFLVSRQNQRHSPPATTPPKSASYLPAPLVKRNYDQQYSSFSSGTSTSNPFCTNSTTMATTKLRPSPSPNPANTDARPSTPTSPVQIPAVSKTREIAHAHKQHRQHASRRHVPDVKQRDVHSPDAIPPSVAALLAVTSIPLPTRRGSNSHRKRRAHSEKRMTVESIIEQSQELEKELSSNLSLGRSPMDMLLSAPDDSELDDVSLSDSNLGSPGSPLSTRTVSEESVPSLDDSFNTSAFSSVETPTTSPRSRKMQPMRKPLEPLLIPGEQDDHPLSSPRLDIEELDFRVFEDSPLPETESGMRLPFKPLKSAFKSNLTASLRALRQAAKSFSALNFPSIPPEDFLTRSILTIDPRVPYTDERRPPPLEEEPTPALRRYFNPTTNARLEQPSPLAGPVTGPDFTASIQMQTYKVQRARSAPPANRVPRPSSATGHVKPGPVVQIGREAKVVPLEPSMPGPRQREMRENSDFIRIAVMEMAMRKRGKLDDQRPGRARWALPPRKISPKPYEIGQDGVPLRWVAVTY